MFAFTLTTYVLFLLIINNSIYKKIKNPLLLNVLISILYFLFIFFRPITLPDNSHYIELYRSFDLRDYSLVQLNYKYLLEKESGFYFLIDICQFVFGKDNYQFFFLLISIINFYLFFKSSSILIKKYFTYSNINSLFLPLFIIYISYYGFMYNMMVLRAGIAISLLYYSVALKINNNTLGFVLFLLLSLLFHRSAILGIIIVLSILFIPIFSRKLYKIIWLVIVVIFVFKINTFFNGFDFVNYLGISDSKDESLFGAYLANSMTVSQYSLRNLYLILIALFFINNNSNTFKLLNLYFTGLFFQILFHGIPALGRATDYFIFFNIILSLFTYMSIKRILYKNMFILFVAISNYIILYRLAFEY